MQAARRDVLLSKVPFRLVLSVRILADGGVWYSNNAPKTVAQGMRLARFERAAQPVIRFISREWLVKVHDITS